MYTCLALLLGTSAVQLLILITLVFLLLSLLLSFSLILPFLNPGFFTNPLRSTLMLLCLHGGMTWRDFGSRGMFASFR